MTSSAVRVNPYPGLTPFEEQDASRFFGRDREIDELLQRLGSRRLLAVIGVSGCGKSSLVHAGVKPVLRIGAAANLPARWRICTITPGNAPLRALRAALEAPPDWPATSFDLLDQARQILRPGESLLLIVDQFEELFRFRAETIGEDGGNAASLFVNLLLNAIDQREVPIYVLLTMRTDFLGECAKFRSLPEALNDCYYLVPRMTRLQQQDAIERPLQEQGVQMHAPLVQRLLNDSAEDPDQLPVLQHLLRRVWENWNQRGANGPISLADYEAVGGMDGCYRRRCRTSDDAVPGRRRGDPPAVSVDHGARNGREAGSPSAAAGRVPRVFRTPPRTAARNPSGVSGAGAAAALRLLGPVAGRPTARERDVAMAAPRSLDRGGGGAGVSTAVSSAIRTQQAAADRARAILGLGVSRPLAKAGCAPSETPGSFGT